MLKDTISERAVLGGIYQYGQDAYFDIFDIVQPTTFTDETNCALYQCFAYLFDKRGLKQLDQASLISATNELGFDWLLSNSLKAKHVNTIINTRVNKENISIWACKIRKLEIARLLQQQCKDGYKDIGKIDGNESVDFILGLIENRIVNFSSLLMGQSLSREPQLLGQNIDQYLKNIEENPNKLVGISSGYNNYDRCIGGGFRRKTVSLIGARSGKGKSFVANNIALFVADKLNVPVLYLDTEMNEEDHYPRALANLCYQQRVKISISDIEYGKFVQKSYFTQYLTKAKDRLKSIPYNYLNVSGIKFEEILSIMKRWVYRKVGFENGRTKPCLIIFDYIKLMSSENLSRNLQEYQELGFLMTSLHNFTVKNDIPILAFIQLNRDGIDREETDIISGSDRILWLATNFSVFKDKAAEEIAEDRVENGNKKLVVLKHRHGEGMTQRDYINMTMFGKYGTVVEGRMKSQVGANIGAPIEIDQIPFEELQ